MVATSDVVYLTLREAADRVRRRELSAVELTDAVLARTEEVEPRIHAYITLTAEAARAAAAAADREIAAGNYRGPLHGMPIGLKDNFYTRGVRTTGGAKVLGDFVPDTDATVVARLREAGAVLTGKLNLHELAIGSTTTNPHYGTTHNPWNLEHIPGGSSGGSGAALAAGMCFAATGTDTRGSIRNPGALCGVVGLKPTYGRVSICGVVPLSWTMDHAGPLARTVEDAALVLNAIAGYDPADATTVDVPVPDFTSGLGQPIRGLRLGVVRNWFFDVLHPDVRAAVEAALPVFEALGAIVEDLELPGLGVTHEVFEVITRPEAASWQHELLATRPDDYGADVRMNLELGELILAVDYVRALQLRRTMAAEQYALLRRYDAFIAPTRAAPASRIGATSDVIEGREVLVGRQGLTAPFNLSGIPAISVPCGFSAAGLPIGLQIAGRPWDEVTVLRLAHAYEQATDWHQRRPAL
jgi:aspartyl-tRNA(Asn)/glutamyl-tRNA(Gln) amidotransferase subunit A